MWSGKILSVAALSLAFLAGSASADSLNLQKTWPDFVANNLTVTLNDDGVLNATGLVPSVALTPATTDYLDVYGVNSDFGSFDLTASLDGDTLRNGTVTISGQIPGLGLRGDTLLTGDIVQFGYSGTTVTGSSVLEFVFRITGGDFASRFGGIDAYGATLMSFVQINGQSTSTQADNFPVATSVPLPGVLPGSLLCMGVAAGIRRFRSKRASSVATA